MPAVLRAAGMPSGAADPVTALAGRARAGDPDVLAALDRAGGALGLALTATVNLVDPAAVVLGGAYAELADWLLPALRRELTARLTLRPWDTGAVTASALGRRGPVVGAALVTVRRIIDDPGVLTDQAEASG
jgi:predicted NBD/HSP70 family sugar kinase